MKWKCNQRLMTGFGALWYHFIVRLSDGKGSQQSFYLLRDFSSLRIRNNRSECEKTWQASKKFLCILIWSLKGTKNFAWEFQLEKAVLTTFVINSIKDQFVWIPLEWSLWQGNLLVSLTFSCRMENRSLLQIFPRWPLWLINLSRRTRPSERGIKPPIVNTSASSHSTRDYNLITMTILNLLSTFTTEPEFNATSSHRVRTPRRPPPRDAPDRIKVRYLLPLFPNMICIHSAAFHSRSGISEAYFMLFSMLSEE